MRISETAMLVRLSISQWTGKKFDKTVTAEVATTHAASNDAGRYNKALVVGDAFKAITTAAGAARTWHYANTLPWTDEGLRILPAKKFMDYTDKMRGLKDAFEAATRDFIAEYPGLVDLARIRLNGMFRAEDFPAAHDLAEKFAFATEVSPIPDGADFRVSLHDGEAATIRADITARTNAATAAAMRDLWQRLYDSVSRMAATLPNFDPQGKGADRGTFRDSLIDNARDLVNLLPDLNIGEDAKLEELRRKVEAQLCRHDAETLRSSDATRADVATAAADIAREMAGFMAGAGTGE